MIFTINISISGVKIEKNETCNFQKQRAKNACDLNHIILNMADATNADIPRAVKTGIYGAMQGLVLSGIILSIVYCMSPSSRNCCPSSLTHSQLNSTLKLPLGSSRCKRCWPQPFSPWVSSQFRNIWKSCLRHNSNVFHVCV